MTKTVLIVDDELSILVPVRFLMEQLGHQVLDAQSGEEALEIIIKTKPDLILLDIMLPGIDGYEVCEILRLNPKYEDIKIIFLTAKGRELDVAKGLALGADSYIVKPFSNKEVVEKVKALLGNSDDAGDE